VFRVVFDELGEWFTNFTVPGDELSAIIPLAII
jgi:hypothetical protein